MFHDTGINQFFSLLGELRLNLAKIAEASGWLVEEKNLVPAVTRQTDLIVHLEVQQEYRASLALEHLFGLNNYTGNQPVQGCLLLEQGLRKIEQLLVLLVFCHGRLVGLSILQSNTRGSEELLTELTIRQLTICQAIPIPSPPPHLLQTVSSRIFSPQLPALRAFTNKNFQFVLKNILKWSL